MLENTIEGIQAIMLTLKYVTLISISVYNLQLPSLVCINCINVFWHQQNVVL